MSNNNQYSEDLGFSDDPEELEVVMGNSGKAVLVGDDEESDGEHSAPLYYENKESRGCYPSWLKSSSPKVKVALGLAITLLLAFVAVFAVGITQMSSKNEEGNELKDISSAELGANTSTDPTEGVMTIATEKPPTSPPVTASVVIDISSADINVALPDTLEAIVPDFKDGLDNTEQANWETIDGVLVNTIGITLLKNLPLGYTLEPIDVEMFDGFDVTSYGRRGRVRGMKEHASNRSYADNVHNAIYSSSATVDCSLTDCDAAPMTMVQVLSDMSQMEYIEAKYESSDDTTTTQPTDKLETFTTSTVISTDAVDVVGPPEMVEEPTAIPVKTETAGPSASPTATFSTPVTMEPQPLVEGDCSPDTPCEMCSGACSDDTDCADGLSCFYRLYLEYVPGCTGAGKQGQRYCYNPLSGGLTVDMMLPASDMKCDNKKRCTKCQGDCDTDDDCDKNLYCYRRLGYELVPGCGGQGAFGADYCFDPKDIPGENDY